MTVESALLAGGVLTKALQAGSQMNAASSQMRAIELQQKEKHLQLDQKRLSLYSNIEKTLATQSAQATTKGISATSPSVNAIQRETLSIGSENFQNIKTEKELADYNAEIQKQNVNDTLTANLIGDVTSGVQSFAKLKGL